MPTILQLPKALKYGSSWEKLAKCKLNPDYDTFKGNKHTMFGSMIEESIREYINKKYNTTFLEDTRIDKKRGYRANVDGYDGKRLLEVKTYSCYVEFDFEYYLPQCEFYLDIYDCDELLLVAYKKNRDFCVETENSYEFDMTLYEENISIYIVKRDKEYFRIMEESINGFKEYFKEFKRLEKINE